MSRSIGKSSKGHPMSRNWHRSMRARERMLIHREIFSTEYGDVIFPIEREVLVPWDDDFSHNNLYCKKEIRDNYFCEIRNILNGYQERGYCGQYVDPQEVFIEAFNRIKKGECSDGKESCFAWLNTREAKEAVKQWVGDPLDVLYYLSHSGIIEKAVRKECKRMLKK